MLFSMLTENDDDWKVVGRYNREEVTQLTRWAVLTQ